VCVLFASLYFIVNKNKSNPVYCYIIQLQRSSKIENKKQRTTIIVEFLLSFEYIKWQRNRNITVSRFAFEFARFL